MDIVERICISVNTRCNLGCKYCYFFNPENRINSSKDLSIDEIYTILLRINEYAQRPEVVKKIKVNFVGSGEPLLSWNNIKGALLRFNLIKNKKIKFYTVTNATLITEQIAEEMKELEVFPSVSLDGYKELHDMYRVDHKGRGSYDRTMHGIDLLEKSGFNVAINTVVSRSLLNNIEGFLLFLESRNISKVIFDRIVDTPLSYDDLLDYDEYYFFLERVRDTLVKLNLEDKIEVGNLEAYSRSFNGKPDKVCTMFGSSCGAGSNFLIYIGNQVYPCGRMFGKDEWLLGSYNESIIDLQSRMYDKVPQRDECSTCVSEIYCERDCLLEYEEENYSCKRRIDFLTKMKTILR